jgi:hypothetical protein
MHVRKLICCMAALALAIAPAEASNGWTSNWPAAIIGYQPPPNSGSAWWSDYQTYVVPHLSGIVVICQWATMETNNASGSAPVYDFVDNCDNKVANYVGRGLSIGIVLSPITYPPTNLSTPSYVYGSAWASSLSASQLDYCACGGYTGNGTTTSGTCSNTGDTTSKPAMWEKPFYIAWQRFLAAAISHYNSVSWASQVSYVRIGYSSGGEAFDHCETQFATLAGSLAAFKSQFLTGFGNQVTYEQSQTPAYYIMHAVNISSGGDATWADTEASDAVAGNEGAGCEGFSYLDQVGQATCDWKNIFSRYYTTSVPLELQFATSNGTTALTPINQFLPIASMNYAKTVEFFQADLLCAYDPNYSDSVCTSGMAPFVPFQQAIAALAQGTPGPVGFAIRKHAN